MSAQSINTRITFILGVIFFLSALLLCSNVAWAKKQIEIGILLDGSGKQQKILIQALSKELYLLLGSKYDIRIPDNKILFSDWSASKNKHHYNKLVNDNNVDIIIVAGILSSSVVLQQKHYSKPVIVVGIVDHLHLDLTKGGTSGIRNLTYILFNRSITHDLASFYRVFQYKRVGIVANKDLLKFVLSKKKRNGKSPIKELMLKNKTKFVAVSVDNSINDVIDELEGVDAVYISYLGRLEGKQKTRLIRNINAKRIPSFGASIVDVERGVLAATAPKHPLNKLIRRLALNIEAILDGKNPSRLPVHLSFEEKLTINMKTAQQINLSPSFRVMSGAVLVNEFADTEGELLSLKQAIQDALDANLALAIQADNVKSSELNVDLARSNNYPSLSFNATDTLIDEDRAESSFGKQAETTVSGTLKLQQLIYSDGQSGNVEIQEHLLNASQYGFEQQKLDVILDTATTYFSVLKAKTGRSIQQENVKITRQNLNIAKQREAAGFSGRSDVYFWESQLATATTDYLVAINQYKLTQIQLNQLLNRRLDNKFTPENISLSQGVYSTFIKNAVQNYVDTPYALERFTDFLVKEAMNNSPEVLQIIANINAQQRRLKSSKRKQYIPDINLVAEKQHIFSRNGAGSNVVGVTPDDDTWSASLNFSWSLYEGGSIGIDAKQASNEIMRLNDQRLQLHKSLELEVRASLLDLVNQNVNLKSSQRSADFARKSLDLVQDAYSRGKISIAELSDAQKTSTIADQKSLNAIYDYFSTVLKTERAVGKFSLLSKPEQQAMYLKRLKQHFNQPLR